MDLLWELDLKRHQQTDGLERVVAPVDVVAQEQVVVALDVAVVVRNAPQVEEPHEVLILAVNVAEHFDRRVHSQNHRLLFEHALALLSKCYDVLSTESKVPVPVKLCSPLTRSQQMVQKQVK